MNRENIIRVADAIEAACQPDAKPEIGFNMELWKSRTLPDLTGHNCGTTACIGGWTESLFPGPSARVALGLKEGQAHLLFFPSEMCERELPPGNAVAVLRHFAETGEVDWSIGAPQTEGAA